MISSILNNKKRLTGDSVDDRLFSLMVYTSGLIYTPSYFSNACINDRFSTVLGFTLHIRQMLTDCLKYDVKIFCDCSKLLRPL